MNALLLLLVLLVPSAAAQTADASAPQAAGAGATEAHAAHATDMAAAVAAYRDGRYAEASDDFAKLATEETDPSRAAVLHCNAGTAAARAERFGEALWQLRRARLLLPRDPQTAANLERVRALLTTSAASAAAAAGAGAPAAAADSPQFARTLRELPLRATTDETATACSIGAAVALLLLAGWRAGRLPRGVMGLAVLLLCASAGWWAFATSAWERERRLAVVIEPVVNGRAEPAGNSEVLFRLPAGSVVSDEELHGEWRLVQSDNGARGWVPAEQVRPLR